MRIFDWLLLGAICVAGSAAAGPYRYAVADLGPVDPARYTNDLANWGINDAGHVLGFHQPLQSGSVPTGGGGRVWLDQNRNGFYEADYDQQEGSTFVSYRELRTVGVASGLPGARVMDISASDVVAGTVYDATGQIRAAKWTPDALHWGPQGPAPVLLPGTAVGGLTINSPGQVLDPLVGALWTADGTRVDLAARFQQDVGGSAPAFLSALDLNDNGELLVLATVYSPVTQSRYFIWTPGTPPFDSGIRAGGGGGVLNSAGQAALTGLESVEIAPGFFADLPRTVVWDRESGEIVHLGVLLTTLDINDNGLVIGTRSSTSGSTTTYTAEIWDHDDGLQDLNSLVVHGASIHLTRALRVNSFGDIVAIADVQGSPHACVVHPVEGLDRWWATAGSGSLDVTWTVRVGTAGTTFPDAVMHLVLSPRVSTGAPTPWGLSSSPVADLRSNGWRAASSHPIDTQFGLAAALGITRPGTYAVAIRSFLVPTFAATSELDLDVRTVDKTSTLRGFLLADHASASASLAALSSVYCPVLYFDGADPQQLPVPVTSTWGLPNTEYERNPSLAHGVLATGDASAALDLSGYAPLSDWDATSNPRAQRSWGDGTPVPTATVYAEPVSRGGLGAINYYFQYVRDDWAGANKHEGDWEGVTVFFVANGPSWDPVSIGFGQHVHVLGMNTGWDTDGGVEVPWADVRHDAITGRPEVHVGRGGHASYPRPGTTYWWIPPFGLDTPEFHPGGHRVDPGAPVSLPRLGGVVPGDADWEWLVFPGHWGLVHPSGKQELSGPGGPLFQELANFYSAPLSSPQPVGLRWLDPWTWVASWGPNEGSTTNASSIYDFEQGNLSGWIVAGNASLADDGAGNHVLQLAEGSDASVTRSVPLDPGDSLTAMLRYRFVAAGDGDRLVLRINGTDVWSAPAPASPGQVMGLSPPIALASFAGQTVNLELRLRSAGSRNATVWVDNLVLSTGAAPVYLDAPPAGGSGTFPLSVAPNPVRGHTRLSFTLPSPGPFDLAIYDLSGRRLRTLARTGAARAGMHAYDWDGRTTEGRRVPPGIYFATGRAHESAATRRIVVLE